MQAGGGGVEGGGRGKSKQTGRLGMQSGYLAALIRLEGQRLLRQAH